MARSVSPLLVLVIIFLILNSLVIVVRAPVKAGTGVMSTDKTDYFLGERVQAKFVTEWTGRSPPLLPMAFEWFTPANVTIFNETLDMIPFQIGNDKYLGAYSNWTSNMTGTGFRVKGTHNDSGESDESYFNVWNYDEIASVEILTLSLNSNFYENNTVAWATATLGYLGNGTKLGNVTIDWRYPNSTLAFTENVTSPDGGMNGTSEVSSFWAVDFVGTDFEVQATYNGVRPLSDIANFDVISRRVKTWKNASIAGNPTWALSDSPFGVCDNITIQSGASLTVEAGSVIRFCPDTGIIVHGALAMDGQQSSKINLTSYSYPGNRGDWKGIAFEADSVDSLSFLNEVTIEYSQTGLALNEASPTMTNVSVSNSSISGVEVHLSSVYITGLKVTDSGRGVYAVDSTLDLWTSEILRCDDGIVMEDSNGTLHTNYIHHNTERGIWLVRSNPAIRKNTISLNADKGIRIEDTQDILIEESTVSNSNFGMDIFQSLGIWIRQVSISNGALAGLSFWTTDDVLVENSTVDSSFVSFRVAGGSVVRTLNCTFNDSVVTVTGGSRLYVDNYLDVNVSDTAGASLEGASITLIFDGIPTLIGSTGQDGWMRWHIVRYETFSGIPSDPNRHLVDLEVSLDGYNITNSPRQVNMSISHTEAFEGQRIVSPDGDGLDAFMLLIISIVGGIIAALAIIFLILAIRRKKKAEEEEVPEFELEEGEAYIITHDGTGRSFDRFVSEIENGASGLCFTRTYPENLKSRYDLEKAKVLWLSRDTDRGGLLPTNLGLITNEVDKFLNKNKDGRRIILLDGMEYLIAQNEFGKVLKLLNHLKDMMGVSNGTLLIPFDIKSVEEKEAAMLKANLKIV
jgi:parallel beta-helix repeat protein